MKYLVEVEICHTFTQFISETLEIEADNKEDAAAIAQENAEDYDDFPPDNYEADHDDTDINIIKVTPICEARCKKTPDMFEVQNA